LVKVRVRQHVNPLSQKYQTPVTPPEWSKIYQNCDRPLHLDIGCARGEFLLNMARSQPNINFLGIEIREPLVIAANLERDRQQLTNLYYLFGNINTSDRILLESLPVGKLQTITIQFPDPWFKNRHAKRRVITPELVNILADYLIVGGTVFLQSDIELLAQEMSDRFQESPCFQKQHKELWLEENPLPVATEREIYTRDRNLPVYRTLFKSSKHSTTPNNC
jgi:tRNA (guanine-N7-)-methyltransferase